MALLHLSEWNPQMVEEREKQKLKLLYCVGGELEIPFSEEGRYSLHVTEKEFPTTFDLAVELFEKGALPNNILRVGRYKHPAGSCNKKVSLPVYFFASLEKSKPFLKACGRKILRAMFPTERKTGRQLILLRNMPLPPKLYGSRTRMVMKITN